MNDPAKVLVIVFTFVVAVCIVSLIGGRIVRPPRPAEHERHDQAQFLPCAQPMSPRARALYAVAIALLLLATVGMNYWPSNTAAPLTCQTNGDFAS